MFCPWPSWVSIWHFASSRRKPWRLLSLFCTCFCLLDLIWILQIDKRLCCKQKFSYLPVRLPGRSLRLNYQEAFVNVSAKFSCEIKRCLLLGRKAMTNLDSILKSRHYFANKVKASLVKAMVSAVVMYGCESWLRKRAERQRIDAFELWCWRRLLRVPWTARRSNQSILKEISPEYSLEGLDAETETPNTLATWCEELAHLKRSWCWERLKTGGEWDDRGWDSWMASLTWWTWVWASSGSWWWTGKPGVLQSMGPYRVGHDWETELNWTESSPSWTASDTWKFLWLIVLLK